MYLKKTTFKETGRVFLQIAHGYRDRDGKPRTRIVEKLGYLDVLQQEHDDPIAHFTERAKALTAESKASRSFDITVRADAAIERGSANCRNFGYAVLSKVYHELELDRFFRNAQRHQPFEYNSEGIMRLLAYARALYPKSKKATLELKDRFFDKFDFTLDDVYSCLSHFSACSAAAQKHMFDAVRERYGMDGSLMYYDVTNYYFETDAQDGTRKRGCSKENRKAPIIQLGLAMDSRGIPIAFQTFPGNKTDSETLIPTLKSVKKEYGMERAIVVADKGLNCGDNIAFNVALGDGYIFSQSIRGGAAEFQSYVLSDDGYGRPDADGFKVKSRVVPATAKVTVGVTKSGRKSRKAVPIGDQKQVVFYSPKHAARAKREREELVSKAREMVARPGRYSRATHYGASAYVSNIAFAEDGEIIAGAGNRLSIDETRIAEEERLDGYYAIVTSEADMSDQAVIEAYKGLWRIEETFRISKSVIRTRPVFVYTKEHIEGHFLVCFIALLLLRLIELRIGHRFDAQRVVDTLRDATCVRLEQSHYLFHLSDEVTDTLGAEFGIDFTRKYMSLGEIRSAIGATKKK